MLNFTKDFSILFCLAAGAYLVQCLSNSKDNNIRKSSKDGAFYISSDSEQPVREGRILRPPIFIPINIPGWVPPPTPTPSTPPVINNTSPTTTSTTTTPSDEGDNLGVSNTGIGGVGASDLKPCKKSCCESFCIYAGPKTNLTAICTGDTDMPCNLEISNLAKCHNSALPRCHQSKCSPRSSCNRLCSDILAWGYVLRCS